MHVMLGNPVVDDDNIKAKWIRSYFFFGCGDWKLPVATGCLLLNMCVIEMYLKMNWQ